MAILTYDEYMSKIQAILGERDDEETLTFLQDTRDTFGSHNDGEDWKKKYEENDATWRRRYRDAFFSGPGEDPAPPAPPADVHEEPLTFDKLFRED